MIDKIKELFRRLNSKGFAIPMLRDPKTGDASVSLTMTVISFNVVLIGLVGKWSKMLGDIDVQGAIYWFITCSGLYFMRRVQGNGKDITLDTNEGDKK